MTALLAQHLLFSYTELHDKPDSYSALIRVPINRIDGVKCDTFIHISKIRAMIRVETERTYVPEKSYEYEESEPTELYNVRFSFADKTVTEELLIIMLDKWFMDLGEIKFDKRSSLFQLPKNIEMWSFLNNISNLILGDKCPVCYEMTANKVCCSHHICIPCLVELKPNKEDEILCPVCRAEISYH